MIEFLMSLTEEDLLKILLFLVCVDVIIFSSLIALRYIIYTFSS